MERNALVPITYQRHRNRHWTRFTSYHFAAQYRACDIVNDEVLSVAAAFPIVFRDHQGKLTPHALLSLSNSSSTPFVSGDGRWLASYVPSALRCPPFHLGTADTQKPLQQQLCVDEASGMVGDGPGGEAFFAQNGRFTDELMNVETFLKARAESLKNAQELCQILSSFNLLEAQSHHNGCRLPDGCYMLAEKRLAETPQSSISQLAQTGALRLLYAHLISKSHLSWLNLAQKRSGTTHLDKNYTKNSDVSAFLTAFANAQGDDIIEPAGM